MALRDAAAAGAKAALATPVIATLVWLLGELFTMDRTAALFGSIVT
jgi:uncharacterized protein (DUF697 family)